MRFFPRGTGKTAFSKKTLDEGHFPFLAWEKSHLEGVENRGSLISVPLALRVLQILMGALNLLLFPSKDVWVRQTDNSLFSGAFLAINTTKNKYSVSLKTGTSLN